MANEEQVEQFRKHMSKIYKQQPVNEFDYILLCKEAVELAKKEWQDRDIIANRMAHIWLRHEKELSEDAGVIGGLFATLELPDAHIDVSQELSVKQQWEKLEHTIDFALHNAAMARDQENNHL